MAGRARFIGANIYRGSSYGSRHPLRVPRVSTVMDLARALGWLPDDLYLPSPRAKPAALHGFHTPEYIAALVAAETTQEVSEEVRERHHLGSHSNPVFPEMYRRPATGVGGALLAGELLREGGVIHLPGGGTHHGLPDRANGFCYLNDPVFAILSLKAHGAKRVAYVDIDAHHCDGVEAAFANDPDTLLVSTHEENRWPRTGALGDKGAGQVFNLPIPSGLGDDAMALARDAVILPAVAAFRPDAVVLQCGADALLEDPQSRLAMSGHAHLGVLRGLRPLSPRFLVLGGGGYNPWSVGRLWTAVWGELSGRDLDVPLPMRARAVLAGLDWPGQRRVKAPPEAWLSTLLDAPRPGDLPDLLRERVERLQSRLLAWV
ncbi:acetoin utilization protein AcuC [Limimaricola pyoseonensis]|uniref:Acetoin utilization protein AcuC n=1 Tax=Limimaricola pyoseonensis TaxID=521013 RepID=A0A1G7DF67_9RHOB|nr:acetoin utilization protein AcuC [Limimaricola pyoseonensis]SDE49670.1 acetoin utilization protein AcuC [Limimaricola pyoseonensis]